MKRGSFYIYGTDGLPVPLVPDQGTYVFRESAPYQKGRGPAEAGPLFPVAQWLLCGATAI